MEDEKKNEVENKITEVKVEDGTMMVTTPDGKKVPYGAKTTYTIYENGRKDCHIELQNPI